ncbi:hypothetical protein MN086_05335 [Sulfurovum sp. XGS-02]|uniref:hypothetical protein n=1 Tax=Sulfurovum sp. XGS-02 TaxID=2925411 RepID=UPI00206891CD|nr:hypothetical protein [Sulfurovum sp. XGS-02]UPT78573.1 hypothetical protein MN086_05335 [Sulfurovum sp. XGS-02]
MPKMLHLAFLLMLSLTACTPRIGVGGVVASSDGIAASEVVVDSQSGVHGNLSVGTHLEL